MDGFQRNILLRAAVSPLNSNSAVRRKRHQQAGASGWPLTRVSGHTRGASSFAFTSVNRSPSFMSIYIRPSCPMLKGASLSSRTSIRGRSKPSPRGPQTSRVFCPTEGNFTLVGQKTRLVIDLEDWDWPCLLYYISNLRGCAETEKRHPNIRRRPKDL